MIRTLALGALALCAAAGSSALAQTALTPNSKHLSVSKFVSFNPGTGNWERYAAVGFYEPAIGTLKNKVALMPRFSVKGVTFISKSGTTLSPGTATPENIGRIKVSLRYEGDLPNERQRVAVLGQVVQQPVEMGLPKMLTFAFAKPGQPGVSALEFLSPVDKKTLEDGLKKEFIDPFAVRTQLVDRWAREVEARVVSIEAVRIGLMVDGVSVDEKAIPASLISSNGVLPDLFMTDVTEYQLNRMKEGDFQVKLDYGFLDSNFGSINADFRFDTVMKQIVEESRKMTFSAKRSGVQFLGFGKRKTQISQSLREQAKESITQDKRAQTTIEMRDASEDLIAMFESKFFPTVSQAQAIDAHLKAGEAARSAGNEMLAKAHFGYAEALGKDQLDLNVDTDAALKALKEKDYASFIAKGIKIARSDTGTASQYSRVITREISTTEDIQWTGVKAISTQRVVTQFIQQDREASQAVVGVCHLVPWTAIAPTGLRVEGMIPTCVVEGSPIHRAGIVPGELLGKLDGAQIRGMADYYNTVRAVDPGSEIQVERLTWTPPEPFAPAGTWRRIPVKIKTGWGPANN